MFDAVKRPFIMWIGFVWAQILCVADVSYWIEDVEEWLEIKEHKNAAH